MLTSRMLSTKGVAFRMSVLWLVALSRTCCGASSKLRLPLGCSNYRGGALHYCSCLWCWLRAGRRVEGRRAVSMAGARKQLFAQRDVTI